MAPETHEAYAIDPVYTKLSDEENIRQGVLAFRAFLVGLYDALYAKGDAYDTCKKAAHEYENRITLSVNYPFLHNAGALLMRIGYYGVLCDNAQCISFDNNVFNSKLTVSKTLACLKFLTICGIGIDGINPNDKKQNLSDIKAIKITYSDSFIMLTGLKVMSHAEIDYGALVNQDVFLRCDYRVLKKDAADVLSIVQDTIKPLSEDVQEFIVRLHHRYLDRGLTCVVEIKGFQVYIKYCHKRKDV